MTGVEYDVVVLGASGFTGKLVVEYLAQRYLDGQLKWAIAGRSKEKLVAVLDKVSDREGVDLSHIDCIVADSSDKSSLMKMCESTKVVMSSVGPYTLYGSLLVECCVETDTDYCDLTGEFTWVREMAQKYHKKCKERGTRIVHMTGFDSIPSDLGMLSMAEFAKKELGEEGGKLKSIHCLYGPLVGAASHGTMASGLTIASHPEIYSLGLNMLSNPYFLCSPPEADETQARNSKLMRPDVWWPEYNTKVKAWMAPFVMGFGNVRIMQRSLSLLSKRGYGDDIIVRESLVTKHFFVALSIAFSTFAMLFAALIPPLRKLLESRLPGSGSGPSRKKRERGSFTLNVIGETVDGSSPRCVVRATKDPGYGATSQMFAETAIALALTKDELPRQGNGGVLSPASAPGLGLNLVDRLNSNTCVSFVCDMPSSSKLENIECVEDVKKSRRSSKTSK